MDFWEYLTAAEREERAQLLLQKHEHAKQIRRLYDRCRKRAVAAQKAQKEANDHQQ